MNNIPEIVFIIPYRNRPQHKFFFSTYISSILTNANISYEIYFSHQCDERSFNRGATKNIGFLAIKKKYPEHYKDITLVFNDIDTVPFNNILNYDTKIGIIKHFYGFEYALGGILSIKGSDFEILNGYPCFWGWGMEDTVLQKRSEKLGLKIDRSIFFPIGSPEILQLFDGVSRLINPQETWRATNDNGGDGIRTISKLNFSIDKISKNPLDNINVTPSDKIFIINITKFMTKNIFEKGNYYKYDLREPTHKIMNPDKTPTLNVSTNWTHIPFYPNDTKRIEMEKKYGKIQTEEIIKYNSEHSIDPNIMVMPPTLTVIKKPRTDAQEYLQQLNTKTNTKTNTNIYSPSYANSIGHKSKSQKSVNIRLGGVY